MRDLIARGGVYVLVAHALDRLSRARNQQGPIIYECDDPGVRLEFVAEDFENSATSKFIRSARAFVAKVEREKIIERTVRGSGSTSGTLIPGRRPLYGYDRTEDGGAYMVIL